MKAKKDSKNPNLNFEPAIEEKILKGLSSGLKSSKNTAYSLTHEALSDMKEILRAEGFEHRRKAFTAWDKLFSFLSKHPDFGKDASHYTHGLRSHFIGGINRRIYYILGHEREIFIVRIISVEIPLHVQMAINQYTQK